MALTKISTGMLKQDAASSDLNIDAGTLYLDVSNNRVGIATTSPGTPLDVQSNSSAEGIRVRGRSSDSIGQITLTNNGGTARSQLQWNDSFFNIKALAAIPMIFYTTGTERMRIQSNGDVLFAKTAANNTSTGTTIYNGNGISVVRSAGTTAVFNRLTDDGELLTFRKDSTAVGSIGVLSDRIYFAGANEAVGIDDSWNAFVPLSTGGGNSDNDTDLGNPSSRFKDVYLSGNANLGSSNYLRFTAAASGSDASVLFGNSAGTGGSLTFKRNSDSASLVTVKADGNVGIGTTSPAESLSVVGGGAISGKLAVGSTATHGSFHFYNQNNAYFNGAVTIDDALSITGSNAALSVTGSMTSTGASGGNLFLTSTDTGGATGEVLGNINFVSSDASTGSSGTMAKITSLFDSNGDNAAIKIQTGFSTGSGSPTLRDRALFASNGDISFYEDTGSTAKFFWDASAERLGIGTASPISAFHVKGDAKEIYLSSADYNIARIIPRGTGTNLDKGLFSLFDTSVEDIRLDVGGVSWIDTAANVGIGTKTPGYKLDVYEASGNGLRIKAGDQIADVALSVGSASTADKFVIQSGGNVGIGTTTPQSKLDVNLGNNETASIGGTISTGTYAGLRFGYSEAGNSNYRHSAIVFERDDASFGDARGNIHILNSPSGSTSADLGDARLTILPSGNVGIGTTSPQRNLTVVGAADSAGDNSGIIQLNVGTGVNTDAKMTFGIMSNHSGYIHVVKPGSDVYPLILNPTGASGGRVGIGTTSPNTQLQINSATDPKIRLESNESGSKRLDLWIDGGEAIGYIAADQSASQLAFRTAGTERIRIDSAGKVGIGTDAPAYKVDVNGDIRIRGTSGRLYFDTLSAGASNFVGTINNYETVVASGRGSAGFGVFGNSNIRFGFGTTRDSSETDLYISNSDGKVGIGTTSPSLKLDVHSGSTSDIIKLRNNNGQIVIGKTANLASIDLASDADLRIRHGSTVSGYFDASGKVGIGTSSPGKKLEVSVGSSNTDGIRITGSSANTSLIINNTGSNGVAWDISSTGAGHGYGEGALHFGVGFGTPKMKITSAGNVGIGRTDPGYVLDVKGTGSTLARFLSASDDALVRIIANNYGTEADARLFLGENDVYGMTVEYDGNANIGYIGMNDNVQPNLAYSKRIQMSRSGTETAFMAGNVGIGIASPNVKLAVDGQLSTGGRRLSLGILDLNSGTTPTQFKIITNIPFASGSADFTVNIKGFRYGTNDMVDLSIGWHYYNSTFYSASVKSSGAWAPTVTLGVENSKVVIHLASPAYWPKMYVESLYSSAYRDSYAAGWSWADSAISSDSGTPQVSPAYSSNFGNNFKMLDDGRVGIGATPTSKFHVTSAPNGNIPTAHILQNAATNAPTLLIEQVGNGGNNNVNQGLLIKVDGQNSGLGNIIRAIGTNSNLNSGNDIEAFIVKGDGKVGIGRTDPTYALDVKGTGSTLARFVSASDDALVRIIANNYGTEADARLFLGENDVYGMTVEYDGNANIGYIGMNDNVQPNLAYSKRIQMSRSGTETAFMAGNVGIGAASPASKLEVAGGSTGLIISNLGDASAYDRVELQYSGYNSGTPVFKFRPTQTPGSGIVNSYFRFMNSNGTSTSANNYANVTIDGYVGIGTDTPATQLQVAGTGILTLGKSNVNGTITSPHSLILKSVGSGEVLRYYQGSAEVFGVYTSGKVGIGTDTPLAKLHVRDGSAQSGISHTYIYDGSAISVEATEPSLQLMAEDSGTHGGSLLWRYGNNAFAAIANPTTDAIDFTYGVSTANDFQVHSGTNMSSYKKIMSIGGDGNVGIGTDTPTLPLDIMPDSSKRVFGSQQNSTQHGFCEYIISGTIGANAVTITMQCPSYFQAEVVATFQQSNGGSDNNVYFNGVWTNNHETHLFKNKTNGGTVPRIGSLGNATPAFTVGVGDAASNSGKLVFTKPAATNTSGTYCIRVIAYGYSNASMTYVVS